MFIRVLFNGYSISARNCGLVYGLPSPSTWIGFVHALCLQAKLLPSLRSGVTPIIQRFSINGFGNFDRYNFALLRSTERDIKKDTQLDTPSAYFEGGVIFELDVDEEHKANVLEILEDAMKFMRFAGGMIEKQDKQGVQPQYYCQAADTLLNASKIPGITLLEHSLDPSKELLNQIVKLSSPEKERKGWFMPSLMGYRLLEDLVANREGARKGYPHAYADPLLGIVEAKGLHRASRSSIPRWHYDYQREKKLILFKTL